MKAVVRDDTDAGLIVVPYPDAREAPAGAVDLPGQLIADLQLARVRLEQAEAAIRTHLGGGTGGSAGGPAR